MTPAQPAMFGFPGGTEWIIIGVVALLIFGRRLPDVARSVGKSIVEFKKGLRDVKDDIDTQSRLETKTPAPLDTTAPASDKPAQQTPQSPTAPD